VATLYFPQKIFSCHDLRLTSSLFINFHPNKQEHAMSLFSNNDDANDVLKQAILQAETEKQATKLAKAEAIEAQRAEQTKTEAAATEQAAILIGDAKALEEAHAAADQKIQAELDAANQKRRDNHPDPEPIQSS
jgi:hypothetical protein